MPTYHNLCSDVAKQKFWTESDCLMPTNGTSLDHLLAIAWSLFGLYSTLCCNGE